MRAFVVERGFGRLKPGVERLLGNYQLRLYVGENNALVYERVENGQVVVSKVVAGSELNVVPAPPVLAEPGLSTNIMLKFDKPLVLEAGASTTIYTCIPVDAVVMLRDKPIDIMPLSRVKYALYGSVDKGILTRFVEAHVSMKPVTCKLSALTEIEVFNSGSGVATLTRIVFPAHMLSLCYDSEVVYGNGLRVNVVGDVASVQPLQLKVEKCILAPKLVKTPLLEKQRFLMFYGL